MGGGYYLNQRRLTDLVIGSSTVLVRSVTGQEATKRTGIPEIQRATADGLVRQPSSIEMLGCYGLEVWLWH